MTPVTDRNKQIVRRFLEDTHAGRLDVLTETVADHVATHGFPGGNPTTRAEYARFFVGLGEALQDMTFGVDAMVAEGDQVAVRWWVEAVHTGPFFGMPASGNRIRFTGMVIYRLTDGRISEASLYPDVAAVQAQVQAAA